MKHNVNMNKSIAFINKREKIPVTTNNNKIPWINTLRHVQNFIIHLKNVMKNTEELRKCPLIS